MYNENKFCLKRWGYLFNPICVYKKQNRNKTIFKKTRDTWLFLTYTSSCHSSLVDVNVFINILGSLSSDVFERRTSTGSEVFSLLTCLDDIKFVFLNFFTVIEAIWLKICAKPPSKNEKRPLPVDVRRSKTLLLKLPNYTSLTRQNSRLDWNLDFWHSLSFNSSVS